ncbi:hypothetical protein GCM10010347_42930 [Streptomyces cirratus]|uniref:Uncharacterized protein n=1 Tax=Streptomyces cirratus TaxID=68187 RepID=A0ABQ3EW95_9ACTN|nr:hypothetical protein GCM10010347_42930 [Streptomyces cirratus]
MRGAEKAGGYGAGAMVVINRYGIAPSVFARVQFTGVARASGRHQRGGGSRFVWCGCGRFCPVVGYALADGTRPGATRAHLSAVP